MAENFDKMCQSVIDKCGLDGAIPWIMMASLLYYHADVSILTDGFFDRLAREVEANWTELKHPHKPLIDREALKAGSLYNLKIENYPKSVRGAAFMLITGKGFNFNVKRAHDIYHADFFPPDYAFDTYVYGNNKETWREYQDRINPRPSPSSPFASASGRHLKE
ncbi:hypothetical protein J2J97_32300 (plasmid) [Rhizobium bangladeshense]|uniref:DNA ligase LigA-related protein n=1 Tax=Rhizobium bangladeshense TaxID=1138189 RepID=UPI001A983036|nr:hypothetical protein [Rhizobium bangladeshense]QSY98587.1 hypothetical protein J2J97_32300 [Rhizobium bangladeshense]